MNGLIADNLAVSDTEPVTKDDRYMYTIGINIPTIAISNTAPITFSRPLSTCLDFLKLYFISLLSIYVSLKCFSWLIERMFLYLDSSCFVMSREGVAPVPEGEFLVPIEKYMFAGVRLGTRVSNAYLEKRGFIFSVRHDGLRIFDIRKIDERIRVAAKMIARYDPSKVVVVSAKPYGWRPVEMFCKFTGCRAITGRFIPGTFTNPRASYYIEAELLVATDPKVDTQAITEAAQLGIPIIALVDTDTPHHYVDLIIPCNNKGRRSLALIYWLLAKLVLIERGVLKPGEDLPVPPEEFETKFREIE